MITINNKIFSDAKLEQYLLETQQYIDVLKKELLRKILNSQHTKAQQLNLAELKNNS